MHAGCAFESLLAEEEMISREQRVPYSNKDYAGGFEITLGRVDFSIFMFGSSCLR
jgi:hypothetical protein